MWWQQFAKNIFFCCLTRKLPHLTRKLYLGNFYRAFKKSNSYVAPMFISVILNAFWTLIPMRHSWTVWSILLGKSIFVFKQLVNLLQIATIALSYLLFFWWFQLVNNHIKTWVWKSTETKLLTLKFFEILIKHHQDTRVNTNNIRSSFWKLLAMTF